MRVQLEETLSHAVNKRPNLADAGIVPQEWITLKGVKIGDACSIDEIEIKADTPEQEALTAQQLLSLPQQAANLHLSSLDPEEDDDPPGPLLSIVIDKYNQEHSSLKKWRGKTIEENRTVFKLLVQILGPASICCAFSICLRLLTWFLDKQHNRPECETFGFNEFSGHNQGIDHRLKAMVYSFQI